MKMNSKTLRSKLSKLGYTLGTDIFGWIVISKYTGFHYSFPTLGGVGRFVKDEENLRKYRMEMSK